MSDHTPDRWRLHRGGILNIWQYAKQVFDLSGGRGIFKGTNGSGKSRTMELLLPLCLDGDLRHVGSKGFDTVSVRRLMLEGYPGGPNRIGYAWIELRRVAETPSGSREEFLTCGVGVKAAKSANAVTDSWRFVTPERVGIDVELDDDGVPYGPGQLRTVLGADHVLDSEHDFQTRVGELVYGIRERHRYADLLHLQRVLRNPDIGLKVNEGQLEQILSDALPPLDPDVLARTAAGLDNLEGARANIVRLRRADEAFTAFLPAYRGYVTGVLDGQGEKVRATGEARDEARRRHEKVSADLAAARERVTEAVGARDGLERTADDLGGQIHEIETSPAYAEIRDLQDKARLVDALKEKAVAALGYAESMRGAERDAVTQIVRGVGALSRVADTTEGGSADAAAELRRAGLGGVFAPAIADLPRAEPRVRSEPALVDVDAPPAEVERAEPPAVDLDQLRTAAKQHAEQADSAREAAVQRRAMIAGLHDTARRLDDHASTVAALSTQTDKSRQSELAATERHRTSRARLTESAESWATAVAEWAAGDDVATALRGRPQAGDDAPPPAAPAAGAVPAGDTAGAADARDAVSAGGAGDAVPAADAGAPGGGGEAAVAGRSVVLPRVDAAEVAADPDAARGVEREMLAALRPAQEEAARAVLRTEHDLEAVRTEIADVEGELAGLRSATDVAPRRPPYATADRDPAQGAPFYRLVDFAEGTTDADAAGLEAALEASGLLNAWVTPDGTAIAADTHDTFLTPPQVPPAPTTPTLATILRPATDPDSPVPPEPVAHLLASIALTNTPTPDPASTTGPPAPLISLSTAGHWRVGALSGAWGKGAAEYVGAGARGGARERRIAELEARLAGLNRRVAAAEGELLAHREVRDALDRAREAFPGHTAVVEAYATAAAQEQAVRTAAAQADSLESEHATAQAACQAEAAEHRRTSGSLGLPADAAELADALNAAGRAGDALDRLGRTLRGHYEGALTDLAASMETYDEAAEHRVAAERTAGAARDEYTTAASSLTALKESLGTEPDELQRRLDTLRRDLAGVRKRLPGARDRVSEGEKTAAKLEAELAAAKDADDARHAAFCDAEDVFTDMLAVPGVWEAAAGPGEQVPDDRAAALAQLTALAAEYKAVGEGAVINRLQELHAALAGSHDVVTDKNEISGGPGVLTVTVSDEEGPRPVAAAGRRTSQRLAEAVEQLNIREAAAFEEFFLKDVAEELRRQIATARDLTRRMNAVLSGVQSSQGVHVQLEWTPAPSLDGATRDALALVDKAYAVRTPEENDRLRRALADRVEAERDGDATRYAELLARALDYRMWYAFTVRVQDQGPDGGARSRRVKELSSGETRLVSYVTLFAAAAAFYDALASTIDGPLRLVLLDEAFERLDDPTKARLLEMLADLNMDWLVTWPKGWGVSSRIARMHIYDVLHRRGSWGVAHAHYIWNGQELALDGA
ncbi:MAG TPA: SbcC/MukB-like Walker B domain-containing protein [Streptosporangiaceae bacterium]|jgi:predicted  nucleic acid-binding Zn-ribbon protein